MLEKLGNIIAIAQELRCELTKFTASDELYDAQQRMLEDGDMTDKDIVHLAVLGDASPNYRDAQLHIANLLDCCVNATVSIAKALEE